MSLVERIKTLCKEKKITIAELERRSGISNGQIRKWDNSTPGIDKLITIANYFDISVDYLLGRSENKRCDDLKVNNESDLDNKLQQIISGLKDEEKVFLIAALENTIQLAKSLSKK